MIKTKLFGFKDTVKQELESRRGIKYFFTLQMRFHQAKDPSIITDLPVTFRSEVFPLTNVIKLDIQIAVALKQFGEFIDAFQKNGSGWVAHDMKNITLSEL